MAALATRTRPGFLVSDLEMEDASPSYTSVTLDRLAARGDDTRTLFFITGADAFQEIETWLNYPAILDRCHFVAVSRPGRPVSELRKLLPQLADRMCAPTAVVPSTPSIFLVDAPTAAVSSTMIRDRLRNGESIASLVPADVAAYIDRHGLYHETGRKDFS